MSIERFILLKNLKSELESTNEILENCIVSLDSQGYWELSKDDIKRVEEDEASMNLFRDFLPLMVNHQIKSNVSNDNNKCIIN